MSRVDDRAQLDWLLELAAALAPATAAAFAGARLGPIYGWPMTPALLVGFAATFAMAYGAVRLVPAEARLFALPVVEQAILAIDAAPDDVLWLDERLEHEELLLDERWTEVSPSDLVAELLLDDPLPAADPHSRVVQLFAVGRVPTAGQLKSRIDQHLAEGRRPVIELRDDSDALSEALADLRRSIKQA